MKGMNGIDTARVLRQKAENKALIFITGMKEYVFEAFDVAASTISNIQLSNSRVMKYNSSFLKEYHGKIMKILVKYIHV